MSFIENILARQGGLQYEPWELSKKTKNAKHKFDVLYKIWLELKNLFQTFETQDEVEIEQEIKEIRALLDEDDEEQI